MSEVLAVTPTARTLAECKKRGWKACVVEKWIPQTRRRLDAFGFGDILALDGKPGALLIQATADNGGHVQERATKIRERCTEAMDAWLKAGNRIEVWGWGKRGKAGKRKLWTLRVVAVVRQVMATLDGEPVYTDSLASEAEFGALPKFIKRARA